MAKDKQTFQFPGGESGEPTLPPNAQNRPAVIIESPFAGGEEEDNVKFARHVCRLYTLTGFAAFASHLLYPQFLEEEDTNERQLGIHCGFVFGARSASFIIFALPPWESDLTRGMGQAMDFYKSIGKPCFKAIFDEDWNLKYGEWV